MLRRNGLYIVAIDLSWTCFIGKKLQGEVVANNATNKFNIAVFQQRKK